MTKTKIKLMTRIQIGHSRAVAPKVRRGWRGVNEPAKTAGGDC